VESARKKGRNGGERKTCKSLRNGAKNEKKQNFESSSYRLLEEIKDRGREAWRSPPSPSYNKIEKRRRGIHPSSAIYQKEGGETRKRGGKHSFDDA